MSIYSVQRTLEKAGCRKAIIQLSLKMLDRKSLVEFSKDEDHDGREFTIVRLTEEGWRWLEDNQDTLTPNSPDQVVPDSTTSEDIPF